MSVIDKFWGGGEEDAAKARMRALADARTQAKNYLNPYYAGGQRAYKNYQDFADQLENPIDYFDQVMEHWSPSESFQSRLAEAEDIINNNNARMGRTGTMAHDKQLQDYAIQELN